MTSMICTGMNKSLKLRGVCGLVCVLAQGEHCAQSHNRPHVLIVPLHTAKLSSVHWAAVHGNVKKNKKRIWLC